MEDAPDPNRMKGVETVKKIAVIMGSDSDLPIARKALDTLAAYEVPFEVHVYSAHRTPAESAAFAASARENGFGAIIAAAGQIATRYVDLDGCPTDDIRYNPNGSVYAIEGITSPDGRVFGKMGHSERIGSGLYRNVAGQYDMQMFSSAVAYFRKS